MLSQDAEHHSESQPGCSALLPTVKPQLHSVMLGKLIKTPWEKKKKEWPVLGPSIQLTVKTGTMAQAHRVLVTRNYTNKCRRITHFTDLLHCSHLSSNKSCRKENSLSQWAFSENNFTHNILFKSAGEETTAKTHEHFTPITGKFHLVTEAKFLIWKSSYHWDEFRNTIQNMSSTSGSPYLKIDLTSFCIPFCYRDHKIWGPATACWVTAPTPE